LTNSQSVFATGCLLIGRARLVAVDGGRARLLGGCSCVFATGCLLIGLARLLAEYGGLERLIVLDHNNLNTLSSASARPIVVDHNHLVLGDSTPQISETTTVRMA